VTAEFLWRLEALLDLYAAPYAPKRPQLCGEALPYHLLADVREPWSPAPGKPRRQDYEYARAGPCKVWLACAPLTGTRDVVGRPTRTPADFAHGLPTLAHTSYPDAQALRGVLANWRTHTPGAC